MRIQTVLCLMNPGDKAVPDGKSPKRFVYASSKKVDAHSMRASKINTLHGFDIFRN